MAWVDGSASTSALPWSRESEDVLHHTVTCDSAVLALAVDDVRGRMLVGTQQGDIRVWHLPTFEVQADLVGHRSSVLSLVLSDDYVFSASSDSTVRVWDAETLQPCACVFPASTNTGDIYSLAWDAKAQVLYMGCQDTSIEWISITRARLHEAASEPLWPTATSYDKFFDSRPRSLWHRTTEREMSARSATASDLLRRTHVRWSDGRTCADSPMAVLRVDPAHVVHSAHHSYVYCMTWAEVHGETMLASGAGDEAVRLWRLCGASPTLFRTLVLPHPAGDAVLSLAAWKGTLLAGKQGGTIDVWDMESFTPVRVLPAHTKDVLCLQPLAEGDAYVFWSGGADGAVCRFDRYFRCCGRFSAHTKDVQCLALHAAPPTRAYSWLAHAPLLLTGASDGHVRLWHYARFGTAPPMPRPYASSLLQRLAQFVRYKSVSHGPTMHADDENGEDSRQAAHFLRTTLMELGASDVQLLPTGRRTNPMVLGTFRAERPRRRCLFYGHYDCVPAGDGWDSDPWTLQGRDGYVYGRGVSDNKGPVLAVAHAASELLHTHQLDMDVVMLVEGEQEAGSSPFQACLQQNKHLLGPIDTVLVCNSYWLGEHQPCLTIGLRGVLRALVRISGLGGADQHSGVDGGAEREPMMDMIKLLASLVDADGRVALPHFYDDVRAVTDDERAHLAELAQEASRSTSVERLMALWCMPSLTVHQVTNSSTAHSTVIPRAVEASVSMRIVPDQDVHAIQAQFVRTIHEHFQRMRSSNTVDVRVFHCADWWLGSLQDAAWGALVEAVEAEWGAPVRLIREGGSIPGIAILEKELGAKAVHLPMGQASDHAHLPNERIRLVNLEVRTAYSRTERTSGRTPLFSKDGALDGLVPGPRRRSAGGACHVPRQVAHIIRHVAPCVAVRQHVPSPRAIVLVVVPHTHGHVQDSDARDPPSQRRATSLRLAWGGAGQRRAPRQREDATHRIVRRHTQLGALVTEHVQLRALCGIRPGASKEAQLVRLRSVQDQARVRAGARHDLLDPVVQAGPPTRCDHAHVRPIGALVLSPRSRHARQRLAQVHRDVDHTQRGRRRPRRTRSERPTLKRRAHVHRTTTALHVDARARKRRRRPGHGRDKQQPQTWRSHATSSIYPLSGIR